MKRRILALCMAMCMTATTVVTALSDGGVTVYAAEDTKTVTVSAYDYTAVNAGIEGASETGVIMEQEVSVDSDASAADAVKKAFEHAGVSVEGLDSGYVSSINGLGAGEGYSGWCMAYDNDDYSNYGLSSITLADGDSIRFDYSNNVDTTTDDIGNGWYGNPIAKKLSVAGNTFVMSTTTTYDENYNASYVYSINGKETTAGGTEDDPFVFEVLVPANEAAVSVITLQSNLNSHYAIVSGDWSVSDETYEIKADISDGFDFSVSSLGGKYRSYFRIDTILADNGLSDTYEEKLEKTMSYLRSVAEKPAFGAEWNVMTLARYGYKDVAWYRAYYDSVVATLKSNESAQLDKNKSTENSRTILALTAIGADVTDIGGYNLLEPLADMTFVKKQGLNGSVYALIAFDSGKYDIPVLPSGSTKVQTTREELVQNILDAQVKDGGWAFFGSTADPDMTCMTVQALAPYYKTNENVKTAVDKALTAMSSQQKSSGGFASWGTVNSESCAQVVCALAALGRNADADSDFIKNKNSVLDAMLSFYVDATGGFAHVESGDGSLTVNGMASQQAGYALVAYDRFITGRNTLYDMSDRERLFTPDTFDISISSLSSRNGVVTARWTSASGVSAYDVYRKSSGDKVYTKIASTANTSYVDSGVKKGKTYYYIIKASKANAEGESKAGKVIVLSDVKTAVANGNTGISVTWSRISGAQQYVVFRRDSKNMNWKIVARTTSQKYYDTSVKNGYKYRYAVKATSQNAVSGYVSAATYRISRQKVTALKSSAKSVFKSAYNKNSYATGYQIQYALNKDFKGSKIKTVRNNKTTSLSVKVYKPGSRYYVRVRSYKKSGNTVYYGTWSPAKSIVVKKK